MATDGRPTLALRTEVPGLLERISEKADLFVSFQTDTTCTSDCSNEARELREDIDRLSTIVHALTASQLLY